MGPLVRCAGSPEDHYNVGVSVDYIVVILPPLSSLRVEDELDGAQVER